MSLYELLLFVHVLAAAAWYGAALLLLLIVELASRARDRATVLTLGRYEDKFASLLFIPSGLTVLVSGIILVFDGPWRWSEDGWVIVGLLLFATVFLLGIALIVPAGKKLKELAASAAPEADIDAQINKLRTLSIVDVSLLTVAIFFMTVKPF